jgi:hypothetical protein
MLVTRPLSSISSLNDGITNDVKSLKMMSHDWSTTESMLTVWICSSSSFTYPPHVGNGAVGIQFVSHIPFNPFVRAKALFAALSD